MPYLKASIDLETSRFPQNKVAEILGVSSDTLRTWVKRSRIVLQSPPIGRGKERTYTFSEAVKAGILHYMAGESALAEFADDLHIWTMAYLRASQSNGVLFDWEHRFAIDKSKMDVRLSEALKDDVTGAFHWDHWGVFYSNPNDLHEVESLEYTLEARAGKAGENVGIKALSNPLTAQEYVELARSGLGPMPAWVIIHIGYLVNYLAVNLCPDEVEFDDSEQSGIR